MRHLLILAATMLTLASGPSAASAQECFTPQGALRRSVLDALRAPVADNLKQPIEFVVSTIRVCWEGRELWAFVFAKPQKPGGAPIDWQSAGYFDCSQTVMGLLGRSYPSDPWTVLDHAICPTDVTWAGWTEQYGAPPQLFE